MGKTKKDIDNKEEVVYPYITLIHDPILGSRYETKDFEVDEEDLVSLGDKKDK